MDQRPVERCRLTYWERSLQPLRGDLLFQASACRYAILSSIDDCNEFKAGGRPLVRKAKVRCQRCHALAPREEYRKSHLSHGTPTCRRCRKEDYRRERFYRPPISKAIRRRVWELCEGFCAYCDFPIPFDCGWHLDHVVPVSCRGSNTIDNLVASCQPCNTGSLSIWSNDARDLTMIFGLTGRYLVALEAAGIVDATTFWEKRGFRQALGPGHYQRPYIPATATLEVMLRRVAHLSPDLLAFPAAS